MEVIEQTMAVAAVLALLLGTLWWLRRRGLAAVGLRRKRGRRRMETLERLALGPQQTLHLVRLQGRVLLLASSPAGCALIERVPLESIDRPEIQSGEVGR